MNLANVRFAGYIKLPNAWPVILSEAKESP